MNTVISARGVVRTFGDTRAVDGLDLEIPIGSVTVLLGPNGAGKTTVVRLLTGALAPDSGAISVFGITPSGPDGAEVRRRCGVVPARPALYDRLSGYDNLRYAGELFDVDGDVLPERIDHAATRFGIVDALAKRVGGYSTGMRARLALARAVLHEPDLLLLEAEGLADKVVVLDRGATLVSGSPAELTERFWPGTRVVLDAEEPAVLDRVAELPYVRGYSRNGVATVDLSTADAVPDLVDALVSAGARLTRVEPQVPSLEQIYFEIRSRT